MLRLLVRIRPADVVTVSTVGQKPPNQPHRPVAVGAFTVNPLTEQLVADGETVTGVKATCRASLFELTGPRGLRLTLRDGRWSNGERDVVACERHDSPERFDTLIGRLRLAVLDRQGGYVELRQARLRANGHAGLFDADLTDLDRGAGISVAATLLQNGATRVGTRLELLSDEGRMRGRFGVRFPVGATLVPVVAYVLTRVCPVAAGVVS